jgi:hypothetical protein
MDKNIKIFNFICSRSQIKPNKIVNESRVGVKLKLKFMTVRTLKNIISYNFTKFENFTMILFVYSAIITIKAIKKSKK